MRERGSVDVALLAVTAMVWASIATGLVAAVVPATRGWLSVCWALGYGAAGVLVLGWVCWQVVAEVALSRDTETGNRQLRARLDMTRDTDAPADAP